jgi:ABC-type Zn uptake system ZnuABC Zn-binding protein ZnuA
VKRNLPEVCPRQQVWDFKELSVKTIVMTGFVIFTVLLSACQPVVGQAPDLVDPTAPGMRVLVIESFLADIAQNVAGERLQVQSLIPSGIDPHTFEPTPQDVAKIAESQVLIYNGAGLEEWLEDVIASAGGERIVIEAAHGLSSRQSDEADHDDEGEEENDDEHADEHAHESDPHFWLDPLHVITYVENIRIGLIKADPQGEAIYSKNTAAYTAQLEELHQWILGQVEQIPVEKRLLVTNHHSFGYFADRYGFKVVGAIVPSVSTGASPSAQQMASLVDQIRQTGAAAIFLETGSNPVLAEQIAKETGVKVAAQLYTHSLTGAGGDAPTYLEMMRYNVRTMLEALK